MLLQRTAQNNQISNAELQRTAPKVVNVQVRKVKCDLFKSLKHNKLKGIIINYF